MLNYTKKLFATKLVEYLDFHRFYFYVKYVDFLKLFDRQMQLFIIFLPDMIIL